MCWLSASKKIPCCVNKYTVINTLGNVAKSDIFATSNQTKEPCYPMKRLLSLLTPVGILLAACNTSHSVKPYAGNWTQVTRVNNEYVIYIPCALDLRKMKVTDSAIHEVLPLEVNDCHIVSTTASGNVYHLKGKEATYTFKWEDEKKGTAEWTIQYSASSPEEKVVFVNSSHESEFKQVHQPESDCNTSGDAR